MCPYRVGDKISVIGYDEDFPEAVETFTIAEINERLNIRNETVYRLIKRKDKPYVFITLTNRNKHKFKLVKSKIKNKPSSLKDKEYLPPIPHSRIPVETMLKSNEYTEYHGSNYTIEDEYRYSSWLHTCGWDNHDFSVAVENYRNEE